jgi:hypothetical protein
LTQIVRRGCQPVRWNDNLRSALIGDKVRNDSCTVPLRMTNSSGSLPMSIFSNQRDGYDLHDEVAALRKEIASLGRGLSKRSGRVTRQAQDGASEIYGDIAEALAAALPAMRAPALRMQKAVKDHPDRVVAVAGLAALAVAAAFIWGSRR